MNVKQGCTWIFELVTEEQGYGNFNETFKDCRFIMMSVSFPEHVNFAHNWKLREKMNGTELNIIL